MKNKKGFSIIEIMLAIGIFAVFSVGITYLAIDNVERDSRVNLSAQALLYAEEGIEATRSIRDQNYLLITNGDHGVQLVDGAWTFIPAPETIDNFFSRTITVEDVFRNESGDIDPEGTTYDPDTKKITSEISWYQNGVLPKSVELETYFSNWTGDDWIQTTCDEFNSGTYSDTEILDSSGDCGVKLVDIEEQSEFFSSINLGKHGVDVDVDGNYAYLTVDDISNGLSVINVTDASSPYEESDLDIFDKGRRIIKDGNYVYMGVRSVFGLAIANISDPSYPYVTNWQLTGDYGNQPAISGDYLYMTIDSKYVGMLVYNVESKVFPELINIVFFWREVGHHYDLATPQYVAIDGNYAYVGLDDDHEGFRVLDISNPYDVQEVAALDVGEEVNAIKILGQVAYVGTEESSDSLQVVDISDPENPSVVDSVDVEGEIQDIAISGDYLYAAVDETHAGLAVVNITNPFNPSYSYSVDIKGKGSGIDADDNYVYIATDTSNKGLVIVEISGTSVETSGTYTSQVYDTGSYDTRYNFIEWDYTETPSGSVKFQIRTSSTDWTMPFATWVGPDGTSSTYYETSRTPIVLSPSSSGPRYFQFKMFIESDGATTPVVNSVRVNYTP